MRTNPPLKTAILAAALVVFFALPSVASAGQVVPPGNSAATQYTQVFPTSGGNVAVGTSIGESGGGGDHSPSKVIGKKATEELEAQGSEGAAVAQLAAESAPEPTREPEPSESSGGTAGGGNDGGSKPAQGNDGGAKAGGDRSADGVATSQGGGRTASSGNPAALAAAGQGSSGFSEVLGQATGAGSGQMGAFLPLVLLAALVLALIYAWRRHHQRPETLS